VEGLNRPTGAPAGAALRSPTRLPG